MSARATSPYEDPAVSRLRHEARTLLREQASLYWSNWVQGSELNLAATYAGKESLFSRDSVEQVRRAREAAEQRPEWADDARALRALELYLAGEVISQATASLADQVAHVESTSTIRVGKTTREYRELERLLANEGSAEARARLYAAELPVLDRLNPLLERKREESARLAVALGYGSYADLGAALRDVNLAALAALAERTLESTDVLYARAMDRFTRQELGLPLARTRRSDTPRLFRGPTLDAAFPPDRLLESGRRLAAGLGLPLEKQEGLVLHTEPHPKKNPRAVCFPIDVPSDVRVSVNPIGGISDYRSLFHELGHALHFVQTRRPEWEHRHLGNNTVIEAYGFLLEGVLDTAEWLKEAGMSAETTERHLRATAAQRLYMLRRYAAKVLFEIGWHSGALHEPPQEAYRRLLSRAYGYELTADDARRYLVDHDEFFYAADYLRAWFLAAQLERHLAAKFGVTWWKSRAAGDFLRSLWREGNLLSAEEVARRLGDDGLRPEVLATWLGARLGS